ncbi:MAG: hypothetical protein M9962_00165 [Oligoflexia bacterium]|nr:hypothetical protein [Oligoflexia bacterium]
MQVFKTILFAALLLTSCSSGEEKKIAEGDSSFVINPITGSTEETKAIESSTPNVRVVSLKACIRDAAAVEPVIGLEFIIKDNNGNQIKAAPTGADGCLLWQEEIRFDRSKREQFIEITRIFQPQSFHQGSISIRLGINPWKKGEGVRDLRFQSIPTQNQQLSSSDDSGLTIDSLSVDLDLLRSQSAVADTNIRILFEPKIKRKNIDGTVTTEPITSGSFDVKAQILAYTGDSYLPLTNTFTFQSAKFQKGTLLLQKRIALIRKVPREAIIELAFEATPLEMETTSPIRGKVNLGRLNSLSLSSKAPFKNDETLSFLSPLPQTEEEQTEQKMGFVAGKVTAERSVIKSLDSTTKPNVIEFQLKVCMRNAVSQDPIRNLEFLITSGNQVIREKTNPDDGCLRWKKETRFQFHSGERHEKIVVHIEGVNSYYKNEKIERVVYLNPWKYEDLANAILDEKFDGAPTQSIADSTTGSQLSIPSIWFNYLKRTFDIDSRLNLSTKRTYRFEMKPNLMRLSRDKGWLAPLGTGNGKYRMRMYLETAEDNNPTPIDGIEMIVQSRADTIAESVDFYFNDLRLVSSRMYLYLELEPLDSNIPIQSVVHRGTFDLIKGFAVRLEPMEKIDIKKKIALLKNQREIETKYSLTGAKLFAKSKGFTLLNEKLIGKIGFTYEKLNEYFVTAKPRALGKLCGLFFDPKGFWSPYRSCTYNPMSYLAIVSTNHVEKVYESELARQPDSSRIGISSSFTFSEYESNDETESVTKSLNADAGFRASVPILDLVGLNIGVGASYSTSWSTTKSFTKGKSKNNSRGTDVSKEMTVDEVQFRINADINSCLLVGNLVDKKDKKVYMICKNTTDRKEVLETYYMIYQSIHNSAIQDEGAQLEERPLTILLRGPQRYQGFLRLLQDPSVTLYFGSELPVPAELMKESGNRYDGFYPSLLTPGN